MSDDKKLEKVVKELLDLKKKLEKTEADLRHHVEMYNDHIRNLHIGR